MVRGTRRQLLLTALVAAVLAAITALPAGAAYLRDWKKVLHQPDGTVVHCLVSGDEYFNFYHDEDGYLIIRDSRGWLTYAERVDGQLRPSAHVVGRSDPRSLELKPWLRPSDAVMQRRWERFNRPAAVGGQASREPAGFTSLNNIVMFIAFYDEGANIFTHGASEYEAIFNSSATGANSMKNYFKEASYSKFAISSLINADSGRILVWVTGQPRSYYQPYDNGANPNGYTSDDEAAQREHLLLQEVINGYVEYGLIPPTLNVDTNNDGKVDNITFMVSGETDGWSDLLWPHRWSMLEWYPIDVKINGKTVDAYNFNLDAVTWKEDPRAAGGGVGTLCHEMSHTLGAPDLYHYKEQYGDLSPVGQWDLMEGTTDPPQHLGAYMKMRYLGWLSSIPTITTSGTYTLNPITSSSGNAFKILSPNSSTQYFIVEYRRKTGYFESGIPGSGLIVYRIDSSVNDGTGNKNGPPDEVYIYRPGGSPTANGDINNAHFSSGVGRTAINDTTDPSSYLTNGADGGLKISSIGAAGNTISFNVTVSGSSTCTFTLSPTSASVAAGGGSGTIQVTTQSGCAWSASSSATWLSITSGSSGSGSGSIKWSASANSSSSSRNGTITCQGKTFTATQAGTGGGGSYVYWVETAAKASGSGGASWKSDLGLLNLGGSTATTTVQLFLGTNPIKNDSIAAGKQVIYADLVGQLGTTGSGAVKVTSTQPLAVTSRTYNDQGTKGTYGQYYDGYTSSEMLNAGAVVRLAQLTESSKYRTNIAVTNTGTGAAQVRVTLYNATGSQLAQYTVDLTSGQRKQENQPFKNKGGQTNMTAGYAKVEVLTGSGVIVSASVLDNTTSDPTTIPPKS